MESTGQPLLSLLNHWPALLTIVLLLAALSALRWLLLVRGGPSSAEAQLPRLFGLLFATGIVLVLIVLIVPVRDSVRGQLLGLIGVALTAMIALASTTFVANIMAGLMLRIVGSFRPGDFIRVEQYFGRVSDRGMFHVEIQTEDGDLATLPNLFIATHPVTVVRASGTIITASVSLGYDLDRRQVETALMSAAAAAGLTEPFVHIVELGDFSVSYRVAGRLEKVKALLTSRSRLRAKVLDALHEQGIEIVSPNFMNQRQLGTDTRFIPEQGEQEVAAELPGDMESLPEDIIFDKAQEAATLESMRDAVSALDTKIKDVETGIKAASGSERDDLQRRLQALQNSLQQLHERIRASEPDA